MSIQTRLSDLARDSIRLLQLSLDLGPDQITDYDRLDLINSAFMALMDAYRAIMADPGVKALIAPEGMGTGDP